MASFIPVILCGGAGTRLWPLSTPDRPKAFLSLEEGGPTLLQRTLSRALRLGGAPSSHIVTVTLQSLADEAGRQLSEIDAAAATHVLREGSARNTAAAISLAATYCSEVFGKDAVLWVMPIDHRIGDEAALRNALDLAIPVAIEGDLVTFGIRPTAPETGYGYIRQGELLRDGVYRVDRFVEKPDARVAERYLADGRYLWNSGMFLFAAGAVRDEFDQLGFVSGEPFDRAILEKSSRVAVVPCDLDWMDIGERDKFDRAAQLDVAAQKAGHGDL